MWCEEDLLLRTKEAHPKEACGVIVNGVGVIEIPNVHKDPEHYFEMEAAQLVAVYEEYGGIDGVWHSHPNGDPLPSTADAEGAPPGLPYYIIANGAVHKYRF